MPNKTILDFYLEQQKSPEDRKQMTLEVAHFEDGKDIAIIRMVGRK